MAHTKVYGFCDAKCKVEVVPKKSGGTFNGEVWVERSYAGMGLNRGTSGNSNFMFNATVNDTSTTVARIRNITDDTKNCIQIHLTRPNESSLIELFSIVNEGTTYYATAPTPSNPTDSSTKVPTTSWVNDINNDVVHKSRNEIITGEKTITKNVIFNSGSKCINVYNSNFKRSDPPTDKDVTTDIIRFEGSDNMLLSGMASNFYKDGSRSICLALHNGSRFERIYLKCDSHGGKIYATCPTPDVNATGVEITTAEWVNNKLAQKSKVTNVTSFDQLIELIKSGKRGDSFGLTVDYTGNSMGGITNTDGVETHAFGHYTIEEINVSDSTLNSFQAFGSGEVSGKFIKDDTKSYVHATTGFGRDVVLNTSATAFRVVEDGNLTYFLIGAETVTSFDGYYISI